MAERIHTASVSLSVPASEPTHEFLNKRVNTEMTYCGDIEAFSNEDGLTKLSMASGELTLLLDEDAKRTFSLPIETFLGKNVCVKGFLTPTAKTFQMSIKRPDQLWLSGH